MKTILITISLFFVLSVSGQKELYKWKYEPIPATIVLAGTIITVHSMNYHYTSEQVALTALTGIGLSVATYHITRYIHRRNFYRRYR